MENQAKRIKFNVESLDETCFFDKVPDEVLEKIISFVPNKDNCFLVSKRFQKESINATRNRCRLVLDDENIKENESILKIKKKFNELWYNSAIHFTESSDPHNRLLKLKEVIKYFGSSIKLFNFNTFRKTEDLIDILDLMKNLERLKFSSAFIGNNVSAKTVQLSHLKSLTIANGGHNGSLELLSCPALQELVIESHLSDNFIYNFIRRHTQLKQLTYNRPQIDTIQRISAIEGLRLTSLKIENISHGLQRVDSIASALQALSNQKGLKELKLPITEELDNGQVLRVISELPMLKTFSCYYQAGAYIADILQMDMLKTLKLDVSLDRYERLIRPLATVQNLKLEELKLTLWHDSEEWFGKFSTTYCLELLQAIAKNLRNLKKARFENFPIEDVLIFALNSPSLQSLRLEGCKYSPLLLNILKFQPNLTELGCSSACLTKLEVISTIMEHGKKLEKIIVYDYYSTSDAYSAYESQFPVKRRGSKWPVTVMMRS